MSKLYNGFWIPGTTGFTGGSHLLKDYSIKESKTWFHVPYWVPFFRYAGIGLQHHVPSNNKYSLEAAAELLQYFKISIKLYDVAERDPHVYCWRGWAEDAKDLNTVRSMDGKRVYTHIVCYTQDGHYVGDPGTAWMLLKRGIISPTISKEGNSVCSIGYSIKDGKWYGWSHRAIYGFQIGDTVKKGDCGYVPKDQADFIDDCTLFWSDKERLNVTSGLIDGENELMVKTSWTYSNEIGNKKLRNQISGVTTQLPDEYGKGAWTSKTEEDSRQMASDFASGVS